ncbi:MAG: penicillin acylase family protein, partial [Pseudomonadota bacterium]
MPFRSRNRLLIVATLCSLSVTACGPGPGQSGADTADDPLQYETRIRWTGYGIPHVDADDWGGLGYGFAYATATDGICSMARDVAMVNGELSQHFGAEPASVASDAFHR